MVHQIFDMYVLFGKHEAVEYSLKNGINPNALIFQSFYPLHVAMLLGDEKLKIILLDYGADIDLLPLDIHLLKNNKLLFD